MDRVAPLPAAFLTALADRYAVGAELGRGGMATVYVAEDLRHQRRVAIKVLDPELAAVLGGERFLAEIRVMAGLQHPNLLPLFDSGEAGGLLYYVMPLVDGPTLRTELQRQRQLPVDDAIRIARAIAGALDYAHRQGVVHRDLKPENILLQDGQPLVADFGISLAVATAAGSRLTGTGVSLGTPQYMSPEQAVGDHAVDGRSDIYSLACVLYELLVGDPPFTASTMQAIVAKVVSEPPTSVRTVRPSVPVHVDRALARALAKLPADRFATAREFADALDAPTAPNATEPTPREPPRRRERVWVAVGAAVLALAVLGGYGAWRATGASNDSTKQSSAAALAPVDARPSVAVIPFATTSGDPKDQLFSDGLADELIASLGKLAGLKVAARTSSFALKGKGLGVKAIAESLGVATVVEMSVRHAANRLKVTAQLVSASDEGTIWSQTYDHESGMKNVLTVQENIARAIVQALRVQLGGKAGPLIRPGTTDLAAYELYLKGRSRMFTTTSVGLDSAIAAFNGAIARDPNYAQAFAGLADTYLLRSIFTGAPPREDLPLAKVAASKALALDSTIADAHIALASVLFGFDWDWDGAEREFRTAFALDPSYATGPFRYGIFLLDQRRIGEAEQAFERARVLDPLFQAIPVNLGRLNFVAGRTDRAVEILRQATASPPPRPIAFELLGHAYLKQGNGEAALAAFRRAAVLLGAQDSAHLAYGLAMTGHRAEAETVLGQLLSSSSRRYLPPVGIALAYLGLEKPDSAFQWLERGYRDRAAFMDGLQTILAFEPLHKDPRWGALLRRMGLTP